MTKTSLNKYDMEISRLMGKAIHGYGMIDENEHIAVAVSGGKDSLTLLFQLRERLKKIPIKYDITAIHIDPGFEFSSAEKMKKFFIENDFKYIVEKCDFGPVAHSTENRENPCFLCARLRRKRLFEIANELGCKTIAFGHHKDDIIETFLLNIFFSASVSSMMPVQKFFNGKIKIIRPLYLVEEHLIVRYAKDHHLDFINSCCPTEDITRRAFIKQILTDLYKTNKKIKGNIFNSIHNVKYEYMPQKL